ncbi:MAG: YHYH protein [Acidobacteria bacterium]|nr:YHYH protein [Acidobacteriota bacterium]
MPRRLFLVLLFGAALAGTAARTGIADPALRPWLLNEDGRTGRSPDPAIDAVVNRIAADIQKVETQHGTLLVHSTGVPSYPVGPFGDRNPSIPSDRHWLFRIPLEPEPARDPQRTSLGPIGTLVNGVPIYNPLDAFSYRNRGVWNQNAVVARAAGHDASLGHPSPSGGAVIPGTRFIAGAYHHHQLPPALLEQLGAASPQSHSPIIGYAFDGYPIYGPYGFAHPDGSGGVRRIASSYRLREMTTRIALPDGTVLSPEDTGPPVDLRYPLGFFVEDYEFVEGLGDLDSHNGRFRVTPGYPQGTYAYFATIGEDGRGAFPYYLGMEAYGKIAGGDNRRQGRGAGPGGRPRPRI